MAKLIFIGGKFGGRVYEFAVPKTTVGRGDHNTLTIHDPSVSQTHCEILVYGDEVIVRDLGSRNGTSVDGVCLHNQQRPLKAGQIVKFGSVEARLELPASAGETTDETAIQSYARYRRDQQSNGPKPAAIAMTLAAKPASTPADHTLLLLPRPPQVEEPSPPAVPARARDHEKPSKMAIVLVGGALALGLAILLWLIRSGKFN